MQIALISNTSWYIYNFRRGLIANIKQVGHEVYIISPLDDYSAKITGINKYCNWKLTGAGKNPVLELGAVWNLFRHIRQNDPDLILSFTPRANIYAAVIARILGKKIICNISGLGSAFITGGMLSVFVAGLYRAALKTANWVFFQNRDDRDMFCQKKLVNMKKTSILPGSGVNLSFFHPVKRPPNEKFTFLLVSRLLWEKGIGEYIKAAIDLDSRGHECKFQILGPFVNTNPTAVKPEELKKFSGVVDYLGNSDDVRPYLAQADCVVLPSYREGIPRSLLEAAAMAKPVISTDTAGCREVVDDGISGYLCRVKDYHDLADKMKKILALPAEQAQAMGLRGREKMVREFDEKKVITAYLEKLSELNG